MKNVKQIIKSYEEAVHRLKFFTLMDLLDTERKIQIFADTGGAIHLIQTSDINSHIGESEELFYAVDHERYVEISFYVINISSFEEINGTIRMKVKAATFREL